MIEHPRPPDNYDRTEQLERLASPITAKLDPKPHGTSLCFRCGLSLIYRRRSSFDSIIRCRTLDMVMPHDIEECSGFDAANTLSLSDLSAMAYLISDREEQKGPYR